MNRLVIATVLVLVGVILVALTSLNAFYYLKAPEKRLYSSWQQDVDKLKQAGSLPAGWNDLRIVKYIGGSESAKEWLKKIPNVIKTKTDGGYELEAVVVDWSEEQKYGVVIQYSLIEVASGNKIWELGRTLYLGDKNNLIELWSRKLSLYK